MTNNIPRFLFAAVLGACLGSFANVLVIRWHKETPLSGRSRCPSCDKPLRPRHLVPIFSWIALRGRCADCGVAIHVQYPMVEFSAALLAVIAASRYDPFGSIWPGFYLELLLSLGLLITVVMDLRWKELPLELMVFLGILGLGWRLGLGAVDGNPLGAALSSLLGGGAAAVFFGAQWLVSKGRWLGSGDIWFGGMMGMILGWPRVGVALYLAYLVGGVAVAFLFLLGRIKRQARVPFAPALATGFMFTLWFGASIEQWIRYAF